MGAGLTGTGCRAGGPAALGLVLLAACADPADVAPGPAPPEPWSPPDARGPYGVGVRTLELPRSGGAVMTVEVWYPALGEGAGDPYELVGIQLAGSAWRDAPADDRGVAWPLVVFSHGFGGLRFQSFFLTEHLASHGFVVAAPDHDGTSLLVFAPDRALEGAVRRPRDVADVVDGLDTTGALAEHGVRVDTSRYAMVGHSFGAWTSLVVGGGVLDADAFEAACAADDAAPSCGFFEGQALDREAAAVDAVSDPRAEVVVALAPGAAWAFGSGGLGGVRRPLVIAGTRDGDLPWEEEGAAVWAGLVAPRRLALLEGAGHWGFTDLCALAPVADCAGEPGGYMDPARTQALTQRYTTAHLRAELHGSADDLAWLAADEGVTWQE